MSSSAAINTFRNGDTGVENFTSMQQTILQVLRDKDNFALYNFECGNNATPGIYAGSILAVNYVLYPFNTTELALYLATDGSVSAASSAPDGNYAVIAKPSVVDGVGYCTICLYPYTGGQAIFEPAYGHFIISGTQYRVLALCTKSGTSYTRKRVLPFTAAIPDALIQFYQEGVEIHGSIYGYANGETDSKQLLSSVLTFSNLSKSSTIEITHPCACRVTTFITGEGSDDWFYRYNYNMRFRPVSNLGRNVMDVSAYQPVDRGHDTQSDIITAYGELMPGHYEIQHNLLSRDRRRPDLQDYTRNNGGTLRAVTTLYVGNVFGHRTGIIL